MGLTIRLDWLRELTSTTDVFPRKRSCKWIYPTLQHETLSRRCPEGRLFVYLSSPSPSGSISDDRQFIPSSSIQHEWLRISRKALPWRISSLRCNRNAFNLWLFKVKTVLFDSIEKFEIFIVLEFLKIEISLLNNIMCKLKFFNLIFFYFYNFFTLNEIKEKLKLRLILKFLWYSFLQKKVFKF